jgi:hypothetical protein
VAVLDETNRARVAAQAMREALGSVPSCLKADLRAAVDATDTWVDNNAASYNSALPTAFRTNANAQQKSLLLCWVVMRRAGLLRAEED